MLKLCCRMKAERIANIKSNYAFEAPVIAAKVHRKGRLGDLKNYPDLDLNSYLLAGGKEIYLVRVNGESMIDENIFDGDILVVSSKDKPKDGKIVIAALNGEMAVKTYKVINGKIYLYSANKKFLPIEIMPYWNFEIQGIVKHVIHPV